MKFKRYIKESAVVVEETTPVITEDIQTPDSPSYVRDEIDKLYMPVKKLIADGKFVEAAQELDQLEKELDEFETENSKKKLFKFPQFMIDGQRDTLKAIRAQIPTNESVEDMDKRCEKCNTLLNDGGTCPKCDDGAEDYDEPDTEITEELSNAEKLKRAFPELNFDMKPETDAVVAESVEELEEKETTEEIIEELSNKEKLKRAYPELNLDGPVVEESVDPEVVTTYDDDYYDLDDVEQDRAHAALYGGDRMYCDCGAKLAMDEFGSHCPVCNGEEVEKHRQERLYDDSPEYDSEDPAFDADDEV